MSFHVAATSGILVAGGGTYGYYSSGSRPSLIGGLILGSVFFGGAHLIRNTNNQCLGHSLCSVCGTIALAMGVRRLTKSRPGANRVGAATLLLVGVLNVPYQYIRTYDWCRL